MHPKIFILLFLYLSVYSLQLPSNQVNDEENRPKRERERVYKATKKKKKKERSLFPGV